MKKQFNYCHAVLAIVLLLWASWTHAQICDYQNKLSVVLSDGTPVTLYGQASNETIPGKDTYKFTGNYYYLPANMRLGLREDGTPEFLLLKYTTDEQASNGGVQGALLHFLMQWGLTPSQLEELNTKVRDQVKELAKTNPLFAGIENPTVLGSLEVTTDKENSFTITSSILGDKTMAPATVASGSAPVVENGKVAVASKLDKYGAQLLTASLEKNRSITDVSLSMKFNYSLLLPAVRGKIIIDWSKFESAYEQFKATYRHDEHEKGSGDDTYSYDEIKKLYTISRETKAVVSEIDNNVTDDAVANKVVEEFMNIFVAALTDNADERDKPVPPTEEEKEADPNIKTGKRYRFNKEKFEAHFAQKVETYDLMYRKAVPRVMTITENLSAWYDEVRNNEKCVSSTNLNDKFFQHRDINMILSEGSEQLIGNEVNYVTINVRKQRPGGNDFNPSVTIDREYLKKYGIKATLSYAKDQNDDADGYEYQTQWSFRDGEVYPDPSPWIRGSWEAVSLVAPLKPRTIELEGNMEDLKAAGITRVTLQVRYMKLGREMETNIPLTISKNESLVKATIFTDPQTRGYAYRLVFNHKDEGKMALDWDAKANDDYVYITIPDALKDKTSELFKKAIEIGKEVMEAPSGKVGETSKVLDKFKNVIGLGTN